MVSIPCLTFILAVHHLRTLMNIVATNSEVRKLLTDFGLIGRDLLSKAASKAAENIAPSPDRLANVDRPGPQDQFVTNGGRTTGTEETPVLEARIPGTDHVVSHHPDQPEPQITTNGETRGASQAVGEGQNVLDNAASSAQDEARAHAEDVQRWGFFSLTSFWPLSEHIEPWMMTL